MKRGLKNALLTLLGFSAAPMLTACYGTPYDDFDINISGTVTDEAYTPIEGIRITLENSFTDDGSNIFYTDADGKFELTTNYLPTIVADDVDGSKNGGLFLSAKRDISSIGDRVVNIVMKKVE